MPRVRLDALTKRFSTGGGVTSISLDISAAEHLVVAGPSGAGKTTLLRLIAGLESSDSGTIQFDGRDVTRTPPDERHVAFVGQRPALYPHLDVRRNLAIGVELRQSACRLWRRLRGQSDPVSAGELAQRVAEAAQWLGLANLLGRRVQELSGGEQQRVVLGRAVVARHPLWLLDEPLVHLDPASREAIRAELLLLRERLSPTIIEVTHDPVDALTLGRRVAVLQVGRIEQVGPPAEVHARPASRGVATSLGWPPMNFIDGLRAAPGGREEISPVSVCATLGVRPEDVLLGNGPIDLGEWRLERVDPLGAFGLWTLKQGDRRLRRWARPGDIVAETMKLHVAVDRCHWFDPTTGQRLI